MTIDEMLDKAARELVNELLESTRKEGGPKWYFIVRWKMAALVADLKRRKK